MNAITQDQPGIALPEEEIARVAGVYAATGHARAEGVLEEGHAAMLVHFMMTGAEWWRAFNQGERTWDLGPDSIAELENTPKGAQLNAAIYEGAREQFQRYCDVSRVSEDPAERAVRGNVLDRLLDLFNSDAGLDLFRRLTGDDRITLVDGQATRYQPGHFLTRHHDEIEGRSRIAAYVLNLSPRWRPEWGGLLQFHDDDGDITTGYVPRFNTLHLLRVPQCHSVSFVTPFAGGPRLSVTGWLRSA
ncbi:2OG-Fe(II) oxygenase family protein [Croceicoccus sp. Ery15]|uniref:2OG-Fe(II) oxygenase family protein n=1 Tax=Croceicoccus sp. Ery15 TaxID=1703338 RepID=UPI001E35793C|nr:2OG-Fe(II) oxygenase family protein [Croceicoccus sp. Ery15]